MWAGWPRLSAVSIVMSWLVDRALFALQFNGFDRAGDRCSVDPD